MAAALLEHCFNRRLRRMEEAIQVGGQHVLILLPGVVRECTGNENARIVDQRVHAPEAGQRLGDHLPSRRRFGFYGEPTLCGRIEEGAAPVFVGFDEANAYLPEAAWLARHFPRSRVAFRANNQVAQATAAQSGVGIALLPHYIGRTTPGLAPCKLEQAPPPREIMLLARRQDRKDLPIRAVVDYLIQVLDDERALFEA